MTLPRGATWNVTGDSAAVLKLSDGLARLDGAASGHSIAQGIRRHGTTVRFGQTFAGAVAYFDRHGNEIVVNEEWTYASINVLVQHLAHEGTHVQQYRPDSIDQEYHAYRVEAEVWNQVKGNETDEQCDRVSQTISLGEKQARWIIAQHYPDLRSR